MKGKIQTYSWQFVGSTERKQAGSGTDMFRFVQNFLHSFCDFFVSKLDVHVPQRVINTARIFTHQTRALAERQYAPGYPATSKIHSCQTVGHEGSELGELGNIFTPLFG